MKDNTSKRMISCRIGGRFLTVKTNRIITSITYYIVFRVEGAQCSLHACALSQVIGSKPRGVGSGGGGGGNKGAIALPPFF